MFLKVDGFFQISTLKDFKQSVLKIKFFNFYMQVKGNLKNAYTKSGFNILSIVISFFFFQLEKVWFFDI